MSRTAKHISIRQLHAAVKAALETTQQAHPGVKLDAAAPKNELFIVYRPGIICGIPPYILDRELKAADAVAFAADFAKTLGSNPALEPLGVDGSFEPTVQITGGKISIGFVPGEATITE